MEKAINMINEIGATLNGVDDSKKALLSEIESVIGNTIPDEIKSFLSNVSSDMAEVVAPIFFGYEPIELESLAQMYRDPKDKSACLFLSAFGDLNENLILGEDETFRVIQNLDEEVDDDQEVADMKTVIPILESGGGYIVLVLKDDGKSEIAFATEDYCLSSIAPSLKEYLDNLESGINKGVYEAEYYEEYDELEIEAPEIWSERLEAVG